jgi:NAD(P)-dependent dehydrogenase (short-subunit alcohol dehydrogenase family)
VNESELEGQVVLVTGGGRGVGAGIARELAAAGARVAVSARTREQVGAVAREIGGLALVCDVTDRAAVETTVEQAESELGPIDLLVANAGRNVSEQRAWEVDPGDWWNVFEINVFGVYLCCRAVIPRMLERFEDRPREQSPRGLRGDAASGVAGRIVITGSGAAYLPHSGSTAYSSSKAAVWRFGNVLSDQLEGRIPVFVISPGLVKTEMTKAAPDDAPWTPPELAPRLVRALASGRADALSGRYIHAEHDDIEELIRRADEIQERDLNAIRLQR